MSIALKNFATGFGKLKICSTFALAIRNHDGLWCNGNTADFGSVVLGSSPSRPTGKASQTGGFLLLYTFLIFHPSDLLSKKPFNL